jgi:hypothetical protein
LAWRCGRIVLGMLRHFLSYRLRLLRRFDLVLLDPLIKFQLLVDNDLWPSPVLSHSEINEPLITGGPGSFDALNDDIGSLFHLVLGRPHLDLQ